MNVVAVLLVCAVLGADPKPDLKTYQAKAKDNHTSTINGLLANIEGSTGEERAKYKERLAAARKLGPTWPLPLMMLDKVGTVGTIERKLVVVDTAGPSVKVRPIIEQRKYNRAGTAFVPIGEKEGPEIIIDGVDSTGWKKGETINLPADQLFWVSAPMVLKAVKPSAAAQKLMAEVEAAKTK